MGGGVSVQHGLYSPPHLTCGMPGKVVVIPARLCAGGRRRRRRQRHHYGTVHSQDTTHEGALHAPGLLWPAGDVTVGTRTHASSKSEPSLCDLTWAVAVQCCIALGACGAVWRQQQQAQAASVGARLVGTCKGALHIFARWCIMMCLVKERSGAHVWTLPLHIPPW